MSQIRLFCVAFYYDQMQTLPNAIEENLQTKSKTITIACSEKNNNTNIKAFYSRTVQFCCCDAHDCYSDSERTREHTKKSTNQLFRVHQAFQLRTKELLQDELFAYYSRESVCVWVLK
jgi:hypothetical protein